MRPRPPVLLAGAAAKIGGVAPLVPDAYAAYELRMVSFMAMLLAQDYDRGPARRLEEIDAVAGLLRRGAAITPDQLAARLREAVAASDAKAKPVTMSGLDERLDIVRGALIDLHAWLEEAGGDEAAALLADVWAELRASVGRRANVLG